MPTAAETTAAEVAIWLEAFSVASEDLKQATADAAQSAWLSFDGWYNAAAVAALAKEIADLSRAAQETSAGYSSAYISSTALAAGASAATQPLNPWQPIRNGADMLFVHRRPAEAYKRAIAVGATPAQALAKAGLRAGGLVLTDLTLEERAVMASFMDTIGVTRYRRVIRPELSESGTCGLCVVAADRIYKTSELMALHGRCKCVVMPIIGEMDPGRDLNDEDLGALYEAAGSTKAADLKRTRVTVNEHGEFGPVLTRADDAFRGPDRVALEDDPPRAARLLRQVAPVLDEMEARNAPEGPLEYQRELFDRLSRIVAA